MAYEMGWFVPERVILSRVQGALTLEDIAAFNDEVLRLYAEGSAPVHLVIIHHKLERLPANIRKMRSLIHFTDAPQRGAIVHVGPPVSVWIYLAEMVARMAMRPFYRKESLEGALQLLCQLDPSLPAFPDADLR